MRPSRVHSAVASYFHHTSWRGLTSSLIPEQGQVCRQNYAIVRIILKPLAGVWLDDVSSLVAPSAVLHGFDVNDRMFPPIRPKNVSLSLNSMTNLPEEWTGRFDFINQRFLIAALTHKDWIDAIANLTRVLHPGGWIQLMEPVMWRAGPVTAKHVKLLQALFDARGFDLEIHERLPQLLLKEGYVNIQTEYHQVPLGKWKGEISERGRDVFMGTFRGMRGPILLSGGLGIVDGEEQLNKLLDDMEAEWDNTEGSELTMCVVYAQKP